MVFCTVTGMRHGQFVQRSDARKIYPKTLGGEIWSAIQVTTAASVCAALDLYVQGAQHGTGFIRQEEIDFDAFIGNRFGAWYRGENDSK